MVHHVVLSVEYFIEIVSAVTFDLLDGLPCASSVALESLHENRHSSVECETERLPPRLDTRTHIYLLIHHRA